MADNDSGKIHGYSELAVPPRGSLLQKIVHRFVRPRSSNFTSRFMAFEVLVSLIATLVWSLSFGPSNAGLYLVGGAILLGAAARLVLPATVSAPTIQFAVDRAWHEDLVNKINEVNPGIASIRDDRLILTFPNELGSTAIRKLASYIKYASEVRGSHVWAEVNGGDYEFAAKRLNLIWAEVLLLESQSDGNLAKDILWGRPDETDEQFVELGSEAFDARSPMLSGRQLAGQSALARFSHPGAPGESITL